MEYISSLLSSESTLLEYQKGILKNSSIKNSSNRILRSCQDGKLVIVSGEKESSLDSLLKMAEEILPYGQPVDYHFPHKQSYEKKVPRQSPFINGLSAADLSDLAESYLDQAKRRLKGLSIDMNIEKSYSTLSLESSSGNQWEYGSTSLDLTIQVMDFKESEIFEWNRSLPSPPQTKEDLDSFFEDFFEEVSIARHPATGLAPGTYPFIFTPEILKTGLLASFFAGISPTLIENQTSPLTHKINSRIFSEKIEMEEKALEIPFDGDGLPTNAKPIVKEGILKNFPIPLEYAKKLNSKPTANSFGGFPFSDFYFQPGSGDLNSWVRNLKEGIILVTSYNLTQGNLVNGDLSGIISLGLLVQNGQVKGRVKDRTCTLNLYEVFGNNLVEVSTATQAHGHGRVMSLPWVLSDGIEVS